MEFALGVLHWTPDDFWNSTFLEISCAYIGHARSNGLGPWQIHPNGWSGVMIEQHKQEIEELKKQFPDMPPGTFKALKKPANERAH